MPQPPTRAPTALARFFEGLALHGEALRMLLRNRSLWGPASVPLLLSILAVLGTLGFVVVEAGALYDFVTGWMPVLGADAWYEWLWIGPARAGLLLLGGLLFVVAAGVLLVLALVVAGVAAAPFLDVLSARVERLVTGAVLDLSPGGLRGTLAGALRAVREELLRSAFFLGLQAGILLGGILVPGGQLLAPVAMTAVTILFLPLDHASHVLDRRCFRFADKRRFVLDRKPLMAGFGLGAFAWHVVPGANFLAMPVLVVGGTLLALRHAPAPSGGGGGHREPPAGGGGPRPAAPTAPPPGLSGDGSGPPRGRDRAPERGSATSP